MNDGARSTSYTQWLDYLRYGDHDFRYIEDVPNFRTFRNRKIEERDPERAKLKAEGTWNSNDSTSSDEARSQFKKANKEGTE